MADIARFKAESTVAITNALARLGAARRERLTAEDLKVYVDGLRTFPVAAVVAVCGDLERKVPEEFGPRYPALGTIVAGVRDHLHREQLRREQQTRNLLPEGRMIDPPKVAELRRRFQELVNAKRM